MCAFTKGTSVHCIKHDISWHWLHIALGDSYKQLALFLREVCFFYSWIHIGSFHSLTSPLALSSCVCSLPFLFGPLAAIIQLNFSLRFTSFYPDASPDLFSKGLQHLLLKFTVKEAFALEHALFCSLLIESTPRWRQLVCVASVGTFKKVDWLRLQSWAWSWNERFMVCFCLQYEKRESEAQKMEVLRLINDWYYYL